MRQVVSSEKVPIKMWLDHVEDGALDQARDLANLPFVFKWVALMPDCHFGYAAPIGSVFATKRQVVPNAVGKDIGCLDKDTEFLTETGWKKISEYKKGDKVLQYDKATGEASFVEPIKYIVQNCRIFNHFKNGNGLDQMVCDDHKMLVWKGYKGRGYELEDMLPSDINNLGKTLTNGYYSVETTFARTGPGIDMSADEIRLDVMLAADGCLRRQVEEYNAFELHLSRPRKLKRARHILNRCGIDFKETLAKDGSVFLYFKTPLKFDKILSKYFIANSSQLKIVAEESLLWDGHKGYRSYFSSSNKLYSDVIQFAFSATGIRAGIYINIPKTKNHNTMYSVIPTKNSKIGINTPSKQVKSMDGKKYCFTVPSGYIVVRRNGRIFITGNCGVATIKIDPEEDLNREQLTRILAHIRREVPVGNAQHQHDKDMLGAEFFDTHASPLLQTLWRLANKQVGTLGGGNHFIEIQKGSDGYTYIMVHSGSRGVGAKVADLHHNKAIELNQKYFSPVPKGLSFFPLDSEEGQRYIDDMNACIAYAEVNRRMMLEVIKQAIAEEVNFKELEYINKPHNFAAMENHFGENVMVHRKGTTRARKGEVGLIPGSQGTSSYIVEGLGNEDSFQSCSHGAGRMMSRTKAKQNLDFEAEKKAMDDKGILHALRHTDDLDEAPSSYKDIDEVMELQKDLVSIRTKLTPLAVVKG